MPHWLIVACWIVWTLYFIVEVLLAIYVATTPLADYRWNDSLMLYLFIVGSVFWWCYRFLG